jgi:hypothetical protein
MSIFKKTKLTPVTECTDEEVKIEETSTEIIDEAPNVDHPIVIDPGDGEGTPIEEVEDKPEVIVFEPHHIRRAKLEYQVI